MIRIKKGAKDGKSLKFHVVSGEIIEERGPSQNQEVDIATPCEVCIFTTDREQPPTRVGRMLRIVSADVPAWTWQHGDFFVSGHFEIVEKINNDIKARAVWKAVTA
jgi:hypothetical protein